MERRPETVDLPDCWNDELTMSALFSPIRKATVNPLDKAYKMRFWKPLIENWCMQNKCSFTLSDLRKAFERNGKTPACLEEITHVMLSSGELTEYSEFVKVPPQQSWASWTLSLLVKSPLLWSMQKMKDALISPTFAMESKYVHLGAAKTYGEELTKQLNDHQTIKLVDLQNIFDIVKEKKWRNEDVLVAIHWLRHQGVVSVLEQPDLLENPLLIKVNKKGQTGISELDMAVYSLWSNETTLLKHIEQLETERTAALNEARGYLIKGTRNMAKTSLRKKHELERIIEKKVLTLENVRILLNQLNDSDLDAQVLESYKKGTSVLKAVLKDAGLTEESVSSAMLQLEEVLDVNEEIQAIMSQPIGISTDKDLEEELATLLESSGSSGPSDNTPHHTDFSLNQTAQVKTSGRHCLTRPLRIISCTLYDSECSCQI